MDKGDEAQTDSQTEGGTQDCAWLASYQATFKDDADADGDADDYDKLAEKQHEMKDKPLEEETDLSSGCQGTIANCTECEPATGCVSVCE